MEKGDSRGRLVHRKQEFVNSKRWAIGRYW